MLMNRVTVPTALLVFSCLCGSVHAGAPGWTFLDGGALEDNYSTVPLRGESDQVLGRIQIQSSQVSAVLSNVTIMLSGSRSGLSNFKLWHASPNFDLLSKVQIGAAVATDPGASALSFSDSFSTSDAQFYIFLSADVSASATGSVLANVTGFTTTASPLSGFGGNDPMSNASLPLPISLSRFEVD